MDLLWTGTDVLLLNKYPTGLFRVKTFAFRILVKVIDRWFTERNWVISEHLAKELNLTKPVYVYEPPMDLIAYPKKKHSTFNILYYLPKTKNKEFFKWVYGFDIADMLRGLLGDSVKWIVVDGTQDMAQVYPIVDFYLRPNRHDGAPYMVKECEVNGIPYYWSKENPSVFEAYQLIKETMGRVR